ncbi:DUF2637 domain-containing protein [Nocardia sp. R16R-3T]
MATITTTKSELLEEQSESADGRPFLISRLWAWRPRPLHASIVVTGVVALTSFEMSFAALHDLSVRNLVSPALAANVPIAIDGLVIGSIIATATFRRHSSAWWYATALFVFWTLVSVGGNIEYAREIGGSPVSLSLYAGMPLTMLFAVHLTLMLFGRGRDRARNAENAAAVQADRASAMRADHVPAMQANRTPAMQADRTPTTQANPAPATRPNYRPIMQTDHIPTTQANPAPATQPNPAPATQANPTPTTQADLAPVAQANHAPTTQPNPTPTTQANHAPTTQANPAPTTQADLAPVAQESRDQAAEEDWGQRADEDSDNTEGDQDSASQQERVVLTRRTAIRENTDPLPVAAKKLPTSALPGTATSPRITPTFATTGAGGKTKINPF